ncbi:MAG TPA: cell division protein ZipA C-terminal FtsZ-binding domain-containing protein [Polyangiaceae bacterium]|nr:cell division protein ZipA C-terminal FtsZ-binding domain-containing protein [Polyangiaceae bacterium]
MPIDLSPSSDDVSLSSLQHKAKGVASAAAELGGYAKPRIDVEMAVAQATRIAQVYDRYEEERVRIVLAADGDDLFDGEQIWDVMSCLGLRWGDMDLFHWENRDQSHGDDHLFSVETSSGEGYFLPEEIAAGETHVEDLVFSFGIPRNADPLITYSAMVAAARYAQQRLGGTLYGSDGEPLDVERETARVRACVDELTSAGFPPGEDRTLQLL